ncbi:MAG: hypothetical protein HY298_13155 [Verrucomicrobia bacterium]|nr:hypothetical protein [Verrucomicrobiota bacterium]
MSPELERLLTALYERDTCEPGQRAHWEATLQRLIADSLAKQPLVSRDEFMEAIHARYVEFRRTRRKPSTLPPKA